ncbi:aldo/keto reductase [Lederbergia lenta]|uniref:Aldo/keto reductase family oxidoreductase n=1 Tax=Lederbergia lenta TaxID=1467 RepID=A0A2X4VTE6_LEDLE|nr:aldo/keto reductase [Lederbergia lenta]MEC2325421.1 aldo/keto reductase [Lederbergia lenta]SQI55326.1 aldo/keto reductase family oxidoreductase [Lederbergia lenta]
MIKNLQDTTVLHNGVEMPWFGLGVWKVEDGNEVMNAVKTALNYGYRSIDTAAAYRNEEGVGKGIRDSGLSREMIFITSKVANDDQGYESTLQACDESLNRLGLDYLDLYLVHWPVPGKYTDTWRALEKLYKDGKVRAIGVSNFHVHHLDSLKDAEIKPMVNQIEFHPLLSQIDLRSYCKKNGIQIESWSPLMQGKLLDNQLLIEIGDKYNKTPAQIILRWNIQNQVVTIPKSVKEHRIVENADIFDFELTTEDVNRINGLNRNRRIGADPDNRTY